MLGYCVPRLIDAVIVCSSCVEEEGSGGCCNNSPEIIGQYIKECMEMTPNSHRSYFYAFDVELYLCVQLCTTIYNIYGVP